MLKLLKNEEIHEFLIHFSVTIILILTTINLSLFEYNFNIHGLMILPLTTCLGSITGACLSITDIHLYFHFKEYYKKQI